MLEQVVLAGAGTVALVTGTRAIRRKHLVGIRDGLGVRTLTPLFGDPPPVDPDTYTPDTGELTRQILKAMRGLGHASITQSVRALAPHLHVEGAAADIHAIMDFEQAILADIEGFVAAHGQRYRWTLASKPTLAHSIAPDCALSVLRITRARPPHAALRPGTIRAARSSDVRADGEAVRPAGPATRRFSTTPAAPPRLASSVTGTAGGARLRRTRRLGVDRAGQPAPAPAGRLRLFRVGGGNVYHLVAGANIAGRDADRCDIVLGFDDAVSAVHAEIVVRDDSDVTVRDLGSSNGIAIAGRPVTGVPVRLIHGDVLTVGTTQLRLVNGDASLIPTRNLVGQA
jgi:hypothetical protein